MFIFLFTDLEKIKSYIDAFRYGCPPHAGGGIGKSIDTSIDLQTMLSPIKLSKKLFIILK